MKTSALWAAGLALAMLAAGCKSAGNVELLERELRYLEDTVYDLEHQTETLHDKLASCRRDNTALRRELAASERGAGDRPRTDRQRETVEDLEPPEIDVEAPSIELNAPDILVPPAGDDASPAEQGGLDTEAPRARPADDLPGGDDLPTDGPMEEAEEMTDAGVLGPIKRVTLNRFLTGGFNRDDEPGDEGLLIVVEPRDAQGRIVDVPGKLSVVVLDPALDGAAARIARWDFTPDEVEEHFRKTPLGQGYHFELAWPNEPPANSSLALFVRYTLDDAHQFVIDKSVDIDPLGDSPGDAPRPSAGQQATRPVWKPQR